MDVLLFLDLNISTVLTEAPALERNAVDKI